MKNTKGDYGHLVHVDGDVDLFYVFVVEEM